MKKFKKIWVLGWRSLLPKWVCVCFCQAPGSCSTLGSSQSNFKNWGDSELGCSAYEDLLISGSSLFLGVHSFRIPTQMKEDAPGPLTWVGLRLRFLSLDPWMEWLLSHTLQNQRTPLGASGPLCLSHLLGPLFSQDLARQCCCPVDSWCLQESVFSIFPVMFRRRLSLNYRVHHFQNLNSSHR